MTLAGHLTELDAARRATSWLESEIRRVEAPHLEAARRASEHLRTALADARGVAARASGAARERYLEAVQNRRAELLAGREVGPIPLPDGWTVQDRTAAEIVDPEAIPRHLCVPDRRAVESALREGGFAAVPGARLAPAPVFVRRK